MTAATTALEPGWLADLTDAEYFSLDACSATRLSDLLKSPAYCKWAMANEKERTEAMVLGDLCHVAALQPDLFTARFCVVGQCEAVTKAKERCSKGGSAMRGGKAY